METRWALLEEHNYLKFSSSYAAKQVKGKLMQMHRQSAVARLRWKASAPRVMSAF
jgi:hypothetical protein